MPQAESQAKTRMFAAIVILSNALGNYFVTRGMKGLPSQVSSPLGLMRALFTPWVALGVCLLVLWLLSRITFLSWADLSYVLPVTSLGYVANALMGYYFLGEHITRTRWSGTLLIVAGTILVGMSTHQKATVGRAAKSGGAS